MSHNTWIHRIVRPLVKPLVRTWITPNQITTLRIVTALGAAAIIAFSDEALWLWGGLLFLLSFFLDRADGELARLGDKTTPWGHKYDLAGDTFSNAVIFIGLGIGLRGGVFGNWALLMGLVAGLAIGTIMSLVVVIERRHGERAAELAGKGGFDPDDAMLVVPAAIWFCATDWLLLAASVGAPLFLVFMLAKFRQILARSASADTR